MLGAADVESEGVVVAGVVVDVVPVEVPVVAGAVAVAVCGTNSLMVSVAATCGQPFWPCRRRRR